MKIKNFSITNYRSLVDFKVEEFDATTIFYGLNNAGKSNILSALELIFNRKRQYNAASGDFSLPGSFVSGTVENFISNFYNKDNSKTIEYTVTIVASKNEFTIEPIIEPLFRQIADSFDITITGNIIKSKYNETWADFNTLKVSIGETTLYDVGANQGKFYFPSSEAANDITKISDLSSAFTSFINTLNDCVYIIGSDRDMHPVPINFKGKAEQIAPRTFIQFLYNLYLSQTEHSTFEEINDVFNSEPFRFGDISFAHDGSQKNLEIMIKEREIRLPIKSLGSGVLQILYIISDIICSEAKIICIEELEQNLAPKLQIQALRKIQQMLLGESSTSQIILTSHSPTFTKPDLSNAIYLIERINGKTVLSEKIKEELEEGAKRHFVHATFKPGTYTSEEYTNYSHSPVHTEERGGRYDCYYTHDNKLICFMTIKDGDWLFYGYGTTEPVKVSINGGYKYAESFAEKNYEAAKTGATPLEPLYRSTQ